MQRKLSPRELCGLLLAAVISGCSHSTAEHRSEAMTPSVVRVSPIKPVRKNLVRTVEQPGEIHAFERTPVYSKVTGYVGKVHVDLGDKVQAGQPLLEILIPEYEQELKQKQASLAQAAAETQRSAAAVKVAESALASARAQTTEVEAAADRGEAEFQKASLEFERIEALLKEKAVTKKTLDETQAALRAAEASRAEMKAKITSARALADEKEAGLAQARADAQAVAAQEEVAKADELRFRAIQDYTRLTAPFDGVVTERSVDPGHLVQPGKSAAEKPLLVIVRADVVRVAVDVAEIDAPYVTIGCPVTIRIPSSAGDLAGKVTRTAWILHPASRTLRVEIDLPNEQGRLRPGMYILASLQVAERADALALPRTAVVVKDQKAACITIDRDQKITRTPVQIGIQAGEEIEIVSGLTGDEWVIPKNTSAYQVGQAVEIADKK